MSIQFSIPLEGKKGQARRFHGAYANGELEIKGSFVFSGPQPVNNEGGIPEYIVQLFDHFPDIDQIALSGKKGSRVYSRFESGAEAE